MAEGTDGIEEALTEEIRLLITLAGRLGEQFARSREQAMRRAQAQSEQSARELQARFEAENGVARAQFGVVHEEAWWNHATPEEIGRTYQVAYDWSGVDPEAHRAHQRMRDELQARYGIDVGKSHRDLERGPNTAEADLERKQAKKEQAESQRDAETANQQERQADDAMNNAREETNPDRHVDALTEAQKHKGAADQAQEQSAINYDSAQRREGTAQQLEAQGVSPDLIATRMRSDVSQGKPAQQALQQQNNEKTPKAHKWSFRRFKKERTNGIKR